MIIIFSTKGDHSTLKVRKWLKYYKASYVIAYPESIFEVHIIHLDRESCSIKLRIDGHDSLISNLKVR